MVTVVLSKHMSKSRPVWDEQIKEVQAQLARVLAVVKGKGPSTVKKLVSRTDTPFTLAVMKVPLPPKFKMSVLKFFDGTKDTLDLLETYKALMDL